MGDNNPSLQIDQTETLLLLLAKSGSDKPYAYSTLLQLQSQSNDEPSAIQSLCKHLPHLLDLIRIDIFEDDEEIAVLALKCLGFLIYHPSLVSAIPEDVAYLVVESLVKLIMATKMKAVCNLGVWCISIQQFNISFLESQIDSLLRAVIHALDNPVGSLSTTFEAVQAVMKLATQLSKKMRDMSHIWAPAIYRRLLSSDKKERDISERCLQKIKSCILPPPLTLSKAVSVDIKQKLLPNMKEMLQCSPGQGCMKVHTIQAWGWFVRLLGCHAMKNRHLVNDMLKIPEQTFSDPNPQIQIASQVAWEGLIDALIQPPLKETSIGPTRNFENQIHGICKSIKLIMTPIIPVISSKRDISVRLSCLNTWYYMLHKLDVLVNHPSVIKIALEPILEVIFQIGPDDKNFWVWNSSLDLFEDFILWKVKDGCSDSENPALTSGGSCVDGKGLRKTYPIRWLPWDLSKLDFQLKMIQILINQGLLATMISENRKMVLDAAVRIFRSVLKGVQVELKVPSRLFDESLQCINTILRFIKEICESYTSKPVNIGDYTVFDLLESVTEIENSVLASPLYRIPLNLRHIDDLQTSNNGIRYKQLMGLGSVTYMDMVSPLVYLTVLHLSVVAHSLLDLSEDEILMEKTRRFSKIVFSSYDLLENLQAVIVVLYMYIQKLNNGTFYLLKIWRVFAEGLKEHIETTNSLQFLKTENDCMGNLMVYCFLCYPLAICSSLSFSDFSLVSSQSEPEIELVIGIWKSIFRSANHVSDAQCVGLNGFAEGLCESLMGIIDGIIGLLQSSTESSKALNQNFGVLSVLGEIAIYVLKNVQILPCASLKSNKSQKKEDNSCKDSSNIKYILEFIARVLMFQLMAMRSKGRVETSVISRVFAGMASFAGRLCSKQDILLLMEIFSDPLVQWLSSCPMTITGVQDGCPIHELQRLWTQTLDCLQRSQPAIMFDSDFLAVQATLLQTALDHQHPPISDATIKFWNSTYGEKITLSYPQSLLPVLEHHWRGGRIAIRKASLPFSFNNSSSVKEVHLSQRIRVTTSQKTSSRRIEFLEDNGKDLEYLQVPLVASKRRRFEMTEHQREVRRAQQGRERDCDGHGPGVRTYTDVDFSQKGNMDSQESEDLRNPEAILEMLRRSL